MTEDAAGELSPAGTHNRIDSSAQIDVVPGRLPDAPPVVLGGQAVIRSGCVIYRGSVIGDRLETGHYVVIREENRIGDDFSIWSHSVIDYACEIGNGVKIHTGVYIAQYSVIGDDAFVGPGAVFTNDLVPGQKISAEALGGPRIGRSAQIGARAVLLPNVEIGEAALVGAGSVVTRNVPAGTVVAGNPAKIIGSVAELREKLQREGVWMPGDAV